MAKVKPRQMVRTAEGDYRWHVQIVHRDGTASILAAWELKPDGRDGAYVGDRGILRRIPVAELEDCPYPGAVAFKL